MHSALVAERTSAGTRATGHRAVYASNVSDKPPQTYILHTVVLFAVLVTAMVAFLRYKWG